MRLKEEVKHLFLECGGDDLLKWLYRKLQWQHKPDSPGWWISVWIPSIELYKDMIVVGAYSSPNFYLISDKGQLDNIIHSNTDIAIGSTVWHKIDLGLLLLMVLFKEKAVDIINY